MTVHFELWALVLLCIAFGMFLGSIATIGAALVLDKLTNKD